MNDDDDDDDWCCGSFSEGIDQFQLGMLPGLDRGGDTSFHSLVVLGKNECLCASILEYRMENRFLRVGLI